MLKCRIFFEIKILDIFVFWHFCSDMFWHFCIHFSDNFTHGSIFWHFWLPKKCRILKKKDFLVSRVRNIRNMRIFQTITQVGNCQKMGSKMSEISFLIIYFESKSLTFEVYLDLVRNNILRWAIRRRIRRYGRSWL